MIVYRYRFIFLMTQDRITGCKCSYNDVLVIRSIIIVNIY